MKNSFLLFTVLFINHLSFSQRDCAKLYVKEHLLGSPICNLSEGDYIEICEDLNEVNGCPRNFYIYDKGFSSGSLTYELSLDRGWSTHYMTLMVNPSTKRFGFIIQGQTAMYSYYTETEMAIVQKNEREQAKLEEQIKENKAIVKDKVLSEKIGSALSSNNCFLALQYYEELYYKDETLKTQIDKSWSLSKIEYDALYKQYKDDFNKIKTEYYENSYDFLLKYKEYISERNLKINGSTAISTIINQTQDSQIKERKKNKLENSAWLYTKQNTQHLLVPLCVDNNKNNYYYDTNHINIYKICVQFDTTFEIYYPMIGFYKNDSLLEENPIVNEHDFNIKKFTLPYSEKLKELSDQVINKYGEELLKNNYPLLTINMGSIETISIKKLKLISKPEEGKKNNMYEKCQESFKFIDDDIQKRCSRQIKLFTKGFYNPALLYYARKMFPNADSLIFVYSDRDINEILGEEKAIKIFESDFGTYYVVPLQKGSIEIKQKQDQYNWVKGQEPYILYVYDKNGNYTDKELGIIAESKISLSEINIKNFDFDSSFYNPSQNPYDRCYELIAQYPLQYEQIQIGIPDSYNRTNLKDADYYFSEDLCVKVLPLYNSNNLVSYGKSRMSNVLVPPGSICFNLGIYFSYNDYDPVDNKKWKYLSSYFKYITKYFENKNEKDLLKADKYLEEYKEVLYQN